MVLAELRRHPCRVNALRAIGDSSTPQVLAGPPLDTPATILTVTFDAETWVALGAAVVSACSAVVAVSQAKSAKRQAAVAENQLALTEKQLTMTWQQLTLAREAA